MKPTSYVAHFDSASALTRALANYLHGRDFSLFGAMPAWRAPYMKLAAHVLNRLPNAMKEQVYIWSGRFEAIAARKLQQAKTDRVLEWIVSLYPKRTYPAIAIGSSNGALTHLWAALGIPWLPQTFLIPVARSRHHPDEPWQDVKWADQWAPGFLAANPDVQLHHMYDPNQDRLMIQRMAYFRVKQLCLGEAYGQFVRQTLAPEGTIFLVECGLQWPTTKLGERRIFQFGALGGATPAEYFHGGKRVEDYLARYHSHRKQWQAPAPDTHRPEAEWGFEPRLREDIEQFAKRHGFHVRRIIFEHPEQMSPLVADFYQWWNRARNVVGSRLLVESFIVMEPYWTVRTGSAPFWMVFNKEPSAAALEAYLDVHAPFDEIYLMLFSHGVESIGLAPMQMWRSLVARAAQKHAFVGVDERAYPRDFAVFVRYYFDLQRNIPSRYAMPPSVTLKEFEKFLTLKQGCYPVQWLE